MIKPGEIKGIEIDTCPGLRGGNYFAMRVDDCKDHNERWLLMTEHEFVTEAIVMANDLEEHMKPGRLYRCCNMKKLFYMCLVVLDTPCLGIERYTLGISSAIYNRAVERAARALANPEVREKLTQDTK